MSSYSYPLISEKRKIITYRNLSNKFDDLNNNKVYTFTDIYETISGEPNDNCLYQCVFQLLL